MPHTAPKPGGMLLQMRQHTLKCPNSEVINKNSRVQLTPVKRDNYLHAMGKIIAVRFAKTMKFVGLVFWMVITTFVMNVPSKLFFLKRLKKIAAFHYPPKTG